MIRITTAAAIVLAFAVPALAQSKAPVTAGVANKAPTTLGARKAGPTPSPAAEEQAVSANPVGGSEPVARTGVISTETKKPQ